MSQIYLYSNETIHIIFFFCFLFVGFKVVESCEILFYYLFEYSRTNGIIKIILVSLSSRKERNKLARLVTRSFQDHRELNDILNLFSMFFVYFAIFVL